MFDSKHAQGFMLRKQHCKQPGDRVPLGMRLTPWPAHLGYLGVSKDWAATRIALLDGSRRTVVLSLKVSETRISEHRDERRDHDIAS